MQKLTGQSADVVSENIDQLKTLFPEAVTEGKIDFETLKQLLGDAVEEREEKYGLNWHGKRKARQLALTPSTGTLRPCPEESVDWDTTQNLMIEGDNLEVLKLLQKSYAGKVKLIYIDPPYNTGKDFVYPDNFQDNIKNYLELTGQLEGGAKISSNTEASGRFHTDWLNMIYPRLKLARNLMRADGIIFISIDDNEASNLKKICDEIFGEENFLSQLVWKKKYIGGKHAKHFVDFHEYILVYAKEVTFVDDFLMDRPEIEKQKFELSDEYVSERGKHYIRPLKSNLGLRETLIYPITCPDGTTVKHQWMVAESTYDDLKKDGRIVFKQNRDCKYQVYRKFYEFDGEGKVKVPSLIDDVANANGKIEIKELFKVSEGRDIPFENPKPIGLISYLIKPSSSQDDIIIDFFAGSGTTGHATVQENVLDGCNRRYILVQLPELLDPENKDQKNAADFCSQLSKPLTIAELTKERLRRAGKKIKEDNPLFAGDLGFRVFKLDTSNIRAWQPNRDDLEKTLLDHAEHIVAGRSEQDILYELLLKLGLDLTVPIEQKTIADKTVYSIGAGALMVCLSETIDRDSIEPLAQGIIGWHSELMPAVDTRLVFRDSAFADDVAKTNLTAILQQHGLDDVRSL